MAKLIDKNLKYHIDRCTLCGLCQDQCPTYQANFNEKYSCRGRMSLAKGIIHSNGFKNYGLVMDILDSCIFCGKCNNNCPEKINPLYIIISIIYETNITSKNIFNLKNMVRNVEKKTFSKDLLMTLMKHRRILSFLKLDGLIYRLMGFPKKRAILTPAKKNFFHIRRVRKSMNGYPEQKIIMYMGCLGKYIFPEVIIAAIGILRDQNIQVVVPKEQTCCGYFNISNKNLKEGKRQLEACNSYLNSKIGGASAVVTLCSGCQRMISGEVISLRKSDCVKVPVYNFLQFLSEHNLSINGVNPTEFSSNCISDVGEAGLFKIDNFNNALETLPESEKVFCSDILVYYLLKSNSLSKNSRNSDDRVANKVYEVQNTNSNIKFITEKIDV